MKHKPHKLPLSSLTEHLVHPLFVLHTLPLPNTAAHSGGVITVLSIQKAVGRTRCGQVTIDKLQAFESAGTMLIATPSANIFSSYCSANRYS